MKFVSACVACVALPGVAAAAPSQLAPEYGYNYGEGETARSAAMGGALRANSNSVSALFLNPANMAVSRIYHVGGVVQLWPTADRQSYGAAAVDSIVSRSKVAGGLAYTYSRQDPDGIDRAGSDVRFALAFPFSQKFFMGAGGRYLSVTQDGYPRADGIPNSAASSGLRHEDIISDITFDAGVTLKPIPQLSFAVVGNNLSDTGHGFLPLLFGGAAGYGTDDFTLEGDLVADFTTYDETKLRPSGGAEFLAADNYPLRLGYAFDQGLRNHSVSGGIGYLAREFSIDLGVRRVVRGDKATVIVIGFKYHIEASGIGNADPMY